MATPLGREAVRLLLEIPEGRARVLSGAAAALRPDGAVPLQQGGLLRPDGHEPVAAVPHDDEDGPTPLFPYGERAELAVPDPTAGLVMILPERLTRWAVDMPAVLTMLARDLDLPARWQPHPLAVDVVWELGEARVSRIPGRQSVWFVRRRSVAGHVLAREQARVALRDVVQAYGPLRAPERRRELLDVMEGLVTVGWLRPEPQANPARPPAVWQVNPAVHATFAARAARQRFHDVLARDRQREPA